ncbi:hypothetical protein GCM10023177_03670 [Streptomyces violaceoruber]|nr:hypothetical protein JCM4020_10800 [Streptomyces coelicolor]
MDLVGVAADVVVELEVWVAGDDAGVLRGWCGLRVVAGGLHRGGDLLHEQFTALVRSAVETARPGRRWFRRSLPAGQRRKEALDAEVVVEFLGCVAEGFRGTPQKGSR